MSNLRQTAEAFFKACDEGKGWDGCQQYCHPKATFSAQANAISEITSIQGYADWIKGLYTFVTDERYELKSFGVDEERKTATWCAVFHGNAHRGRRPGTTDGEKPRTRTTYIAWSSRATASGT